MIRSILWFRQDLRLHDNEALQEAIRNSDELIPAYIIDPAHFAPTTIYGTAKTGGARTRFLLESLYNLRQNLRKLGSDLIIHVGKPEIILTSLASVHKVNYIFCNRERTREEVIVQDALEKNLWSIGREVRYSRGKMLYYTSDLPFPVTHCPDSFAIFKKEMEFIPVRQPFPSPSVLPPLPDNIDRGQIPEAKSLIAEEISQDYIFFHGGETEGIKVLHEGLSLPPFLMAHEGMILSPWMSLGCLSPKEVYHESHHLDNSEEIQQHLLYRDYLRLMGKKYGDLIFHKSGLRGIPLKSRHDPKLFRSWKEGKTGIEIIDAAMHQLNQTGWIPDTLRRLVSGYFIKVLQLDWRLGAAYFESRLIDYDPCTNWVSWLNMAGLGPDTREDRIINYDAVGKKLDPEGIYINAWEN